MELAQLMGTAATLGAFLLTLVQIIKTETGLRGRRVLLLSLLLGTLIGAVCAAGGLIEFSAFRKFPDVLSGALTGLLGGVFGSGSKALVSGVQRNGVKYRAELDAELRRRDQGNAEANPTPDEEWVEESLDTYSRTDWPATPATEDPNYRPIAQDARAGWDFDPRQ